MPGRANRNIKKEIAAAHATNATSDNPAASSLFCLLRPGNGQKFLRQAKQVIRTDPPEFGHIFVETTYQLSLEVPSPTADELSVDNDPVGATKAISRTGAKSQQVQRRQISRLQ